METDKTLADLRHKFHILKNKVNDEAKDWASLSYLQSLVEAFITCGKRLSFICLMWPSTNDCK